MLNSTQRPWLFYIEYKLYLLILLIIEFVTIFVVHLKFQLLNTWPMISKATKKLPQMAR